MILIDNTLISEELFDRKFVCDLNACKGACCIEGASGAPLDEDELDLLEAAVPAALPYLTEEARERIKETGLYERDVDGDLVTPLMGEEKECVYTVFDEKGIAKCSLEMAWRDGKSEWMKPVSCHLYPIRLKELKDFVAVNVNRWKICEPACACGEKLDVPVYKFLRESLIRKFGEDWYQQLELAAKMRNDAYEQGT